MPEAAQQPPEKKVTVIPAKVDVREEIRNASKRIRVAAYCRVSTKQEEQLNSYEVQVTSYTEKISSEPDWILVGIFADRGISGTSVKKRDEFNKLMRLCKRGKVDMIITKSISRFARNTVDCLKYTRMLKEYNVDVFFEDQGIHSTQPGAEFYITIYGSVAQSESENISANVRWGKDKSAKAGNVPFQFKRFLGYRKGEDGKPEIDPEQAVIVRRIYERFLRGDSFAKIAADLNADGIPTASGSGSWVSGTIQSILTNEKYMGDAIINKTCVRDCLSKKVERNTGQRPMYYVQNNHPAIIDAAAFGRVQEEIARRNSKKKAKMDGKKCRRGKYSGKYALSELLICGECGTPYTRRMWKNHKDERRYVWRCIARMDKSGRCKHSPAMDEIYLHRAIMEAISKTAKQNSNVLDNLRLHICMGLSDGENDDDSMDIQMRIAQIDAEIGEMLRAITSANVTEFDDEKAKQLMDEKSSLEQKLARIEDTKQKRINAASRIDEMVDMLDALRNHPLEFDDYLVRQFIECVVVVNIRLIKVVFIGGLEVEQEVEVRDNRKKKGESKMD